MEDKEALEQIHFGVHGLRLIANYKPTLFEFNTAKIISKRFASKCSECKAKSEYYNSNPVPQKKDGFMKRLNNALEETK